MKLYTEEQVRKIYDLAFINLDQDGCHIIDEDTYFEQKIEELTPIELTSDEEMKSKIIKDVFAYQYLNGDYEEGFEDGAMWLKEQILNQNK